MIPVTKPFFPPIEEYKSLVDQIYHNEWITNNGPLLKQLETDMMNYLDIEHLSIVANGTLALQIAIRSLKLKGEVITTPFSYVATTSSLVWENCIPVFADIDPLTFNIDEKKIEELITDKTSCILATHVFGNPCNMPEIQRIADKHNLKVIYDASHCFGVKYNKRDILLNGDISTISFHATKVYNMVEGGGIVTKNKDLHTSIGLLRNFGHDGPDKFAGIGTNAKSSEFHAAMGIVNLRYIDRILEAREELTSIYDKYLSGKIQKQVWLDGTVPNFSYYPVLLPSTDIREMVIKALLENNIESRKYFYPLLSSLDYIKPNRNLPYATDISERILCLPLYYGLKPAQVEFICETILKTSL